jgi:hypothetical protein
MISTQASCYILPALQSIQPEQLLLGRTVIAGSENDIEAFERSLDRIRAYSPIGEIDAGIAFPRIR